MEIWYFCLCHVLIWASFHQICVEQWGDVLISGDSFFVFLSLFFLSSGNSWPVMWFKGVQIAFSIKFLQFNASNCRKKYIDGNTATELKISRVWLNRIKHVWCESGTTLWMRRAFIPDRGHAGKTTITRHASFIPHINSIVAAQTHMSSSCPGGDTTSEAKLCLSHHTRSLPQADGALKPHHLGHKPQPGCTADAKELMENMKRGGWMYDMPTRY